MRNFPIEFIIWVDCWIRVYTFRSVLCIICSNMTKYSAFFTYLLINLIQTNEDEIQQQQITIKRNANIFNNDFTSILWTLIKIYFRINLSEKIMHYRIHQIFLFNINLKIEIWIWIRVLCAKKKKMFFFLSSGFFIMLTRSITRNDKIQNLNVV